MKNKAEHQSVTPSVTEYCIFCKGAVSISFTSKHYTHEGAIKRCLDLSKDFSNISLVARKDGTKYQLYPTPNDEQQLRQERQRNNRSYSYLRRMQA